MEKPDITAIIPVKGISRRLPNKNRLPFNGTNLLAHKIRQLKMVSRLKRIIVSSEDDDLLNIASGEGVTVLKRPVEYSDDSMSFGEFVSYICEKAEGEHILWAFVTSPLVEPALYEKAIALYLNNLNNGFDSLITVQKHQAYILDANGPINFRWGPKQKISQELPELYILTNGIFLAPRKNMIKWKYHWGNVPYRMLVDKRAGIDIDDAYDYELAKTMLPWNTNDIVQGGV